MRGAVDPMAILVKREVEVGKRRGGRLFFCHEHINYVCAH